MRALTIRIPDALYRELKKYAAAHRRSINSEVIVCIERSLRSRKVNPEEFLARANTLTKRLKVPWMTDARLRKAKNSGRP
ncbi:MAG TPA: Arc family DNA-binding protein [Candidatus Polarisedimenticolia bacterium]|jgi:plasmid stability protein